MKRWLALVATLCFSTIAKAGSVDDVKITILSTMITDYGTSEHATLGEWGFSALVEVDGRKLLFDTGRTKDVVLKNATALGIDLSQVEDVILSHFHGDHTGGLLTLRQNLTASNPHALSRLHVNKGFFGQRRHKNGTEELNPMIAERSLYEKTGAKILIHDSASEIFPGVWISGPVPRVTSEKNWSGDGQLKVKVDNEWVADTVPDSLSLFIETDKGTVVISGCGHAGLINIASHSETVTKDKKLRAAIGGFHLLNSDDDQLRWTAIELKKSGIEHFVGAHCTGIEATHTLREHLGLPRNQMLNGSVGTIYSLSDGIEPTWIVR
ncbi:MBL fold metallo-hydrolase [Microbulbifer magnicolonia]|uniref:MBL fold metallo-hydrolase n=1 Tax=Microbulbifer magnicolonia TaxID=3109744 RepID=UPI002B414F24|nr:MBL fold metallo-hydrolase [Microbulbifer sp. GG15]